MDALCFEHLMGSLPTLKFYSYILHSEGFFRGES